MSSLKNLRVYAADHSSDPSEVAPPPSLRRYWTRKAIAEWLVDRLSETPLTLVGIDHGFSFPLQYFEKYGLPHDWPVFLNDFQEYWPTDQENTYADLEFAEMRQLVPVILAGDASRKCERVLSLCSILMCPDQWPNPRMLEFHGCIISAFKPEIACISGRSTAGRFRQANL